MLCEESFAKLTAKVMLASSPTTVTPVPTGRAFSIFFLPTTWKPVSRSTALPNVDPGGSVQICPETAMTPQQMSVRPSAHHTCSEHFVQPTYLSQIQVVSLASFSHLYFCRPVPDIPVWGLHSLPKRSVMFTPRPSIVLSSRTFNFSDLSTKLCN